MTDQFWASMDSKYKPFSSYEDWLDDQLKLILAHPPDHVYRIIDPVKIITKKVVADTSVSTLPGITMITVPKPTYKADMDNNGRWKLFNFIISGGGNFRYEVMLEIETSTYIDRHTYKHKEWVSFSQIDTFINQKSRNGKTFYLKKWFIKRLE